MGPVYLAAQSLSGETRYSLSRPSDFKRANADVCLATSPLRITDGRMWGRELPGGHRREREDALANPDEQFVGPMPSCKAAASPLPQTSPIETTARPSIRWLTSYQSPPTCA